LFTIQKTPLRPSSDERLRGLSSAAAAAAAAIV